MDELVSTFRKAEYTAWQNMVRRCYRPTDKDYKNYGGRGITVCDRWRHSFARFFEDMGERPPGLTLDRIDVNGNYEPANCRWATRQQQTENRRPIPVQEICQRGHRIEWIRYVKGRRMRACRTCYDAAQRAHLERLRLARLAARQSL